MSSESAATFLIARVQPVQLHELRRRVLRGDDPAAIVAEPRDEEETARHFGGFVGERLVVCASFFSSKAPINPELASYQLRFMATDFDVQGHGYGAMVLAFGERVLAQLGAEQLWAEARDSALGFYRATGWRALEGSEHLSPVTKLPHTTIYKLLRTDR